MRTIKFRAWDKEKKEMVYDGECDKTEGWYGTDSTHLHVGFSGQISGQIGDDGGKNGLHEHDADIPRDRFILMLSTGLHDKNGKEIWEGDILEHNNSLYPKGFKGWASKSVVRWNSKTASFDMGRYGEEEAGGSILTEVIGNIYENPELLNGDKNE